MQNVTIKKAKLKDKLFLEVEFTETLPGHSKKDTKMSCTVPVHEDLQLAFIKLNKHLAILCDEIPCPKKLEKVNPEEIVIFHVRSFSIGGSDETEGVTISGYKDGAFGTVNLNTPFTQYDDEDYKFGSDLAEEIQACVYEVEQYLFNGKRAPDRQLSLDFGDESQETQYEHEEDL